jgi:DNA-binding response OmpR family regulator
MSPSRFLLVEDDHAIRHMYALILAAAGYPLRAVPDGVDALRNVEGDGLPDVVVLDLLLPTLSGMDVGAELHGAIETEHLSRDAVPSQTM